MSLASGKLEAILSKALESLLVSEIEDVLHLGYLLFLSSFLLVSGEDHVQNDTDKNDAADDDEPKPPLHVFLLLLK